METPPIRAELRIQTICMATLTVMAVALALAWLRPVMIPFIVAAFLAFALRPLVDNLEFYAKLPRTLAVCAALLLALLALLGLGWLVSISVTQVAKNSAQYEDQVQAILDDVSQWSPLKKLHIHTESVVPAEQAALKDDSKAVDTDRPSAVAPPAVAPPAATPEDSIGEGVGVDAKRHSVNPFDLLPDGMLQNWFWNVTEVVTDVVKQSAVVLVFLFFLLLSSVKRDRPIGGAWGEMESQIRAYLITMTALSAACGISVWVVLAAFGIQAAVLFGLLTFLLNFIPNVGSFIATVLPLPVIWMSPELGLPQKLIASIVPAAIQFVIGNFVQPNVMGNSMKLHPVVILMALIFWGMLWGIVGMFLAVPITSVIRIVCDRHELTKPVANLMAGKLDALRDEPLTPLVTADTPS